MSVCRRGGRALKGRVSLLRRVTEQSDGSQRAENNSYSLCTRRRQHWNQPTSRTTNTHTCTRIKPLFRPAFISERQTVSGVRLSTFLCVNRRCYFCSLSYSCAHIRFDIYIPLHLHSRFLFSNVNRRFCPVAQLALRQVHLCSTMGGSNNCNVVLTLAVLLMSRQVFAEVHLWRVFFFFSHNNHLLQKQRNQNLDSAIFYRKLQQKCIFIALTWEKTVEKNWHLQRQQIQYSAHNKLANNLKKTTKKTYWNPSICKGHPTYFTCACYVTADAQLLVTWWVSRNPLRGNCAHTARLGFWLKCRVSR